MPPKNHFGSPSRLREMDQGGEFWVLQRTYIKQSNNDNEVQSEVETDDQIRPIMTQFNYAFINYNVDTKIH